MGTNNPYASPSDAASGPELRPGKSIVKRWLTGFGIGASIPAAFGGYGLYQFSLFIASLPPDGVACGSGAIVPMILILFGAPLPGLIGAAVATAMP